MNVDEVVALRKAGYHPQSFHHQDPELRAVVEWLGSDYFTPGEHGVFAHVHDSLMSGGDPYMVLADFRSYSDAHLRVDAAYRDPAKWAKMAILNTARLGKFSSDRTIREYAKDIWNIKPVKI
jgi:starch phosphorylase